MLFFKINQIDINDGYLHLMSGYEEDSDWFGTYRVFRNKLLKPERLDKRFSSTFQSIAVFSKSIINWNNTIHALFEDWEIKT